MFFPRLLLCSKKRTQLGVAADLRVEAILQASAKFSAAACRRQCVMRKLEACESLAQTERRGSVHGQGTLEKRLCCLMAQKLQLDPSNLAVDGLSVATGLRNIHRRIASCACNLTDMKHCEPGNICYLVSVAGCHVITWGGFKGFAPHQPRWQDTERLRQTQNPTSLLGKGSASGYEMLTARGACSTNTSQTEPKTLATGDKVRSAHARDTRGP